MKRIAPLILVAAVVLVAVGLFLRQRDPAVAFTENREAWAAYEEGESHLQSFRYTEADSLLRLAVAMDPDLAVAQAALGELNGRLGKGKEAGLHIGLADSLSALVKDPDSRLLLEVRLSLSRHSQFSSQRDSLLAVAKASPLADHLVVLLVDAELAKQNNDFERAEDLYTKILEINPNYAGGYNFLGYLYLGQGRYDEAETAMRRYAFVAPDLANPHDSLGDVLMTVGRYEEAEVEFRTALAKDPTFRYSLQNIGWVYLNRGQVDSALELLESVYAQIAGTGMGDELEAQLIDRLFMHRLEADLETYVARYNATHTDGKSASNVRIRHLLCTGQTAAALAELDSAQTRMRTEEWYLNNPAYAAQAEVRILRFRALAAEQAGAHEEAARLLEEVLARTEDLPPHYRFADRIHLAYNQIPLKQYDAARVNVREVLRVNPRISEAALVAATIEAAAGQPKEARRLLDSVERILERADADYPVLIDAQRLRDELPDPDRI